MPSDLHAGSLANLALLNPDIVAAVLPGIDVVDKLMEAAQKQFHELKAYIG